MSPSVCVLLAGVCSVPPGLAAPSLPAPIEGPEGLTWLAGALAHAPLYVTCLSAVAWLLCYRRLLRERVLRARAELEARRQRLRVLRTQIDPHFLFNALNSIFCANELRSASLSELVTELCSLLRRTLDASEKEEHGLEQELAFADSYLRIQQINRPSRIRWRLQVDPGCAGAAVPCLILLTLVENAIKHGLHDCARQLDIQIRAERRDCRLLLSVRNTCPFVASPAMPGAGMGLSNIHERLQVHYGARATLCARRTGPQLFEAVIDLPWRTTASMRPPLPVALSVATATTDAAIDRA